MTSSSDRLDDLLATPEMAEVLEQESFWYFLDHLPRPSFIVPVD